MNLRRKGMLGLIGAIAVFTTVSVFFSNCSSEDDFGEMEEMEFTMASKKMTRAGDAPAPPIIDTPQKEKTYIDTVIVDFDFFTNEDQYSKKLNVGLNITTTMNYSCIDCNASIIGVNGFSVTSASASLTGIDTVKSTVKYLVHLNIKDNEDNTGIGHKNLTFKLK